MEKGPILYLFCYTLCISLGAALENSEPMLSHTLQTLKNLPLCLLRMLAGVWGNHHPISYFVQCKLITPFWNAVFSLLSDIINVPTAPAQDLALLHVGIDQFLKPYRTVILHLLLAAKRGIVRKWSSESPSLIETISDLTSQCTLKKWLANKKGSYCKFYDSLKIWLHPPKCSLQYNVNRGIVPVALH